MRTKSTEKTEKPEKERKDLPVGVFDSGVGGISVLKELAKQLPHEDFLYFGDSAHAPYGCKSREEVIGRCEAVLSHLLNKGVKALVIACNTATSAAAEQLRREHPDLPIVGMEPAIKPAALSSPHPRVLILATEMTLHLDKFNALKEKLKDEASFEILPCPQLVKLVEEGKADAPETEEHLRGILSPFLLKKPDCIVLGCTHFPFAAPLIEKIFDGQVRLFDGSEGAARRLNALLAEEDLLSGRERQGRITFESSDPSKETLLRMKKLFTSENNKNT